MEKLIKGIHHVAIRYKDIATYEEGLRLYRDILGVPILRTWGKANGTPCAMLDTGAGYIELFSDAGQELPGGIIPHLALATDDTDACIQRVRAAGYTVTVEPNDVDLCCDGPGEPPLRARIAFFRGPGGEEVEFFQEK